ncbi:hypothetical protein VP01_2416g7 [Puccinia sorghi]|uniref:Uncharacterized protein n=1 Tax=Puccinia sorghi TaxID=27349 RepID=A0A0L6V6I1_9BASI|nr:hypothetical protein VP01_2416g7 [Puccinia sorghi]
MSGVDMYVAEGPLPEGSGPTTDRLTAVLDTLASRLENLEKAVTSKKAPTSPSRSVSFNTLLIRIEEIAENLTRLEKKVETLSSSTNTAVPAKQVLSTAGLPQWPAILYSDKAAGAAQIAAKINEALVVAKATIDDKPITCGAYIKAEAAGLSSSCR